MHVQFFVCRAVWSSPFQIVVVSSRSRSFHLLFLTSLRRCTVLRGRTCWRYSAKRPSRASTGEKLRNKDAPKPASAEKVRYSRSYLHRSTKNRTKNADRMNYSKSMYLQATISESLALNSVVFGCNRTNVAAGLGYRRLRKIPHHCTHPLSAPMLWSSIAPRQERVPLPKRCE